MSTASSPSLPRVVVHCDGACKGNPGPGGWAAWLEAGPHQREVFGGAPATTNNRMELTAAIEALRLLKKPAQVHVVTDSKYVIDGITKWSAGWIQKGWKDVKNVDLWKDLIAAAEQHTVTYEWVKGHNGHPGNERADTLANEGLVHARRTGSLEKVVRSPVTGA